MASRAESRFRFRRCVFTLQLRRGPMVDASDDDYAELMQQQGGDTVTYCVFQREIAPTTGQVHLQGFICFSKKMRRSSVVALRLFGREVMWFEPARGSLKQCEAYCSKEESRAPGAEPMTVRECVWTEVMMCAHTATVWCAPAAG